MTPRQTALTRKGQRNVRRHLFITSLHAHPKALLQLIQQHWSIGK
jgi:hypothetical protein